MATLKHIMLLVPLSAAMLSACTSRPVKTADYRVVPLPQSIELTAGAEPFAMSGKTALVVNPADSAMMKNAELFSGYIDDLTGIRLKTKQNQDRNVIKLRSELPDSCSEAYDIRVYTDSIVVNGNDSTFSIIKDVLSEVADLFPSEYIHIGGDECPKDRWKECAGCQARIKELGLRTDSHSTAEQKLQTWFMSRAADYLQQRGLKVIGWNEIMEGGLPEGTVVMSWVGIDGAIEAARMGHDAILTPFDYFYFDFAQGDPSGEPLAAHWSHPILLKDVYCFNPAPEALTADRQRHIVGVQANLWCEYVPTFRHAQYMELPRMAALSEVQWCAQDKKDFNNFLKRLHCLAAHYDALDYNYARHTIAPPSGK